MNTAAPAAPDTSLAPVAALVVAVFAVTVAWVALMTAPRTLQEQATVEVTVSDGQQVTTRHLVPPGN